MKRKKLVAVILALSMLFGQTVWAEEQDSEAEVSSVMTTETIEQYADLETYSEAAEEVLLFICPHDVYENSRVLGEQYLYEDPDSYTVTNSNPEVCEYNGVTAEEITDGPMPAKRYFMNLNPIAAGKTTIKITSADGEVMRQINITVQEIEELTFILYDNQKNKVYIDEDTNNKYSNGKIRLVSSDPTVCEIGWTGTEYQNGEFYSHFININAVSVGETVLMLQEYSDPVGPGEISWKTLKVYHVSVKYRECVGYVDTLSILDRKNFDGDISALEVISDNDNICSARVETATANLDGNEYEHYYIVAEGKSAGNAVITLKSGGQEIDEWRVTVKEKPDNVVQFKDPILLYEVLINVDFDDNGFVTQEEMQKLTGLVVTDDLGIIDLSGLEYAVNLHSLIMNNQTELDNIDPLLGLNSLVTVYLDNTAVSSEDRFRLSGIQDMTIVKGTLINPTVIDGLFPEELQMECISGQGVVDFRQGKILATESGDAVVRITYDGYSEDIHVHVDGIPVNQAVGSESDTDGVKYDADRILSSNGTLWEVYPEVREISTDVKNYVADWVYSGRDSLQYRYYTDENDTLWSDSGEIADNAVKFTGHYALSQDGVLTDIYNSQSTIIDDVSDWVEYAEYAGYDEKTDSILWNPTTYVLKNDGTLWSRCEVEKESDVNKFVQTDKGIVAISSNGYLKENGDFFSWSDSANAVLTDAADISGYPEWYIGMDGNTYISVFNSAIYDPEYVNVGKTEVTDTFSGMEDSTYYLTGTGELYLRMLSGENKKVDENVVELRQSYGAGNMCYKKSDGLYYDINGQTGTESTPILIGYRGGFVLEDYGVAGDYNLSHNEVDILTHVKTLLSDTYAVRTDGSVWNISGVPEYIFSLNNELLPGDLDGSGEVELADLRILLRYVCNKTELTTEQLIAADVEKDDDNAVNVYDLRKMLRYICGKIDTL